MKMQSQAEMNAEASKTTTQNNVNAPTYTDNRQQIQQTIISDKSKDVELDSARLLEQSL